LDNQSDALSHLKMNKSGRGRSGVATLFERLSLALITLGVVPSSYSGTPLAKKLGVKSGDRVLLTGAPTTWSIDNLPSNVKVVRRQGSATSDVVVAFVSNIRSLQSNVEMLAKSISIDGALWIAWPRRARGHISDVRDNDVRAAVLPLGLVDVKVAALDDDWSALKMVWRKEVRGNRR
jgi:hypothetical protein